MLAAHTLRRLSRRSYSIRFSENFDGLQAELVKPRLRDFKYPLFHTFLIASATFMGLNSLWYALEYEHVEKKLVEESKVLEAELQGALDEAQAEMSSPSSIWSTIAFWRRH